VQFVVNFEEGGEKQHFCTVTAASEAFLSDVLVRNPGRDSATPISNRCSNTVRARGSGGLWRIFTERKLPTTVFGVATALKRNPEIVAAMKEAGWDIAKPQPEVGRAQGYVRGRGTSRDRGRDPCPYRGDRNNARSAGTPGGHRSTP